MSVAVSVTPWPVTASETVADVGLLRLRRDRATSPRTGREGDFFVVEMRDWLQVIPETRDGRLVMVNQYRHGSRLAGLEFPGGLLDPEDETPAAGAVRELLEETGYGGGTLIPLGSLWAQPAIMSVRIHLFLMRGARPEAAATPDDLEDLAPRLIEPSDLPHLLASGQLNNAMSITALGMAWAGGHLAAYRPEIRP